jgi:hypothetical protein
MVLKCIKNEEKTSHKQQIIWETNLMRSYELMCSHDITAFRIMFRSSLSDSKPSLPDCWYIE